MKQKVLAVTLAICIVLNLGCPTSTQWVNLAIQDLPVVLQILTNVITIISTVQGKNLIDESLAKTLNNIAVESKADLTTVKTLVDEYNAAPSDKKKDIQDKIQVALGVAQNHLSELLGDMHVKDDNTRIALTAAVSLALTTVQSIISLLPPTPTPVGAKKAPAPVQKVKPMTPDELKKAYNNAVVGSFPDQQIR